MTADAYRQVIAASTRDRLDLFLTTANRLGAPIGNVEKDFWVCWTLDALYHRLPENRPRLLFKGGTSLSKGYGLIQRFSEDIDITVFREDLDQAATIEDLQALSKKQQRRRLDAIRDACRAYIVGPLKEELSAALAEDTSGSGRVDVDADDPDGQTLLVWYPEVEPRAGRHERHCRRICLRSLRFPGSSRVRRSRRAAARRHPLRRGHGVPAGSSPLPRLRRPAVGAYRAIIACASLLRRAAGPACRVLPRPRLRRGDAVRWRAAGSAVGSEGNEQPGSIHDHQPARESADRVHCNATNLGIRSHPDQIPRNLDNDLQDRARTDRKE
mgnify:CR=1 FL=1